MHEFLSTKEECLNFEVAFFISNRVKPQPRLSRHGKQGPMVAPLCFVYLENVGKVSIFCHSLNDKSLGGLLWHLQFQSVFL